MLADLLRDDSDALAQIPTPNKTYWRSLVIQHADSRVGAGSDRGRRISGPCVLPISLVGHARPSRCFAKGGNDELSREVGRGLDDRFSAVQSPHCGRLALRMWAFLRPDPNSLRSRRRFGLVWSRNLLVPPIHSFRICCGGRSCHLR